LGQFEPRSCGDRTTTSSSLPIENVDPMGVHTEPTRSPSRRTTLNRIASTRPADQALAVIAVGGDRRLKSSSRSTRDRRDRRHRDGNATSNLVGFGGQGLHFRSPRSRLALASLLPETFPPGIEDSIPGDIS